MQRSRKQKKAADRAMNSQCGKPEKTQHIHIHHCQELQPPETRKILALIPEKKKRELKGSLTCYCELFAMIIPKRSIATTEESASHRTQMLCADFERKLCKNKWKEATRGKRKKRGCFDAATQEERLQSERPGHSWAVTQLSTVREDWMGTVVSPDTDVPKGKVKALSVPP